MLIFIEIYTLFIFSHHKFLKFNSSLMSLCKKQPSSFQNELKFKVQLQWIPVVQHLFWVFPLKCFCSVNLYWLCKFIHHVYLIKNQVSNCRPLGICFFPINFLKIYVSWILHKKGNIIHHPLIWPPLLQGKRVASLRWTL